MKPDKYKSVWHALEGRPDKAANLLLQSELMITLREHIEGWKATQVRTAKRLRITQPRLNDLLRGRIDEFSLDALVVFAERAGLEVCLRIGSAA